MKPIHVKRDLEKRPRTGTHAQLEEKYSYTLWKALNDASSRWVTIKETHPYVKRPMKETNTYEDRLINETHMYEKRPEQKTLKTNLWRMDK